MGFAALNPSYEGTTRVRLTLTLQLHVFEIAGFVVDAGAGWGDPGGEGAGFGDRLHQAADKGIVVGRRQEFAAAAPPFIGAQDVAVGIGVNRGEFADPAVERDM